MLPMARAADDIAGLISRVALGDRAAFRDLYTRTSAKLFGVCLRILKNRAEAEEALQEVYVKVWQRAGRYLQSGFSPISWLVAVARNHCLDVLRGRKPIAEDIDLALDIADAGPGPEQTAIDTGEWARIDRCLDQLDDVKSGAVRGAYLDGYTYEELAGRFGVPLNTMRTWLRRSLIKLKECLSA
jgi:RNA polymerase sigma-70 factor, ECF subfamily